MDEIDAMLQLARDQHVSDIYLLPKAEQLEIQFRYPDQVKRHLVLPLEVGQRWINYLKYRAGMNVAEHRRVQLGAYFDSVSAVFMRLSSVADYQQHESLVIRLINGIPQPNQQTRVALTQVTQILEQRGLLTISGPTGSGKTTFLYQLAQQLQQSRMVMTIEDPVEIAESRFLQLQVNPEAQMTYAALLKAALRHRPDVVVIGEIRDRETAQMACEAAISGHIVLATVHARSVQDVPMRLISLGVDADLVHAALIATVAIELKYEPEITPQITILQF
ncbi:competence type IV pilus ATPase ComGA [Lacticaseibacillus saniviri]